MAYEILEPESPQWEILPPKVGKSNGATVDTGNAVGTGFFRGLTRLAGLPVDTAANVLDLGRAALGAPYIALTGKEPPKFLQVGNRADVFGSGDNLVRSVGATALGNFLINPANSDYEGGYAQNAGAGLTSVIAPATRAQAINQALLGVTGATAGKATFDATGNQALAITAGMSPLAVQRGVTDATKFAIRGGEAGRQRMVQRIQELKDAGIENPTMGLASGNRLVGGIENLLQNTPGAVGTMANSRNAAIAGLQAKATEAADLASLNRGALESGTVIQGGIRNFKDALKARQEALYGEMGKTLPPQFPSNIGQTRQVLADLNSDIPNAPALSKFFKNSTIQELERALASDTTGTAPAQMVTPQPPRAAGGLMNAPIPQPPLITSIPGGMPLDRLPFEAVKKTRTLVGNEIADHNLLSSVPRDKWKALYGGLTEDLGATAARAGPDATRAFERATNYTRSGVGRLERVAPFANATAPEQAFTAMVNASRENVSTLQAVKKTLPEGARGTIAGTVIERLGKATNGVQNESGTAWSPETFLTNWNKMTPRARDELFSGFPNSAEVKSSVDAVAKATSMMRDNSKMWANPSGTGANVAARATLAGIGLGGAGSLAGLLNPLVPLAAGGGLLGARLLAGGLTSQEAVAAIARGTHASPGLLGAQVGGGLVAPGLLGDYANR